MVRMSIRAALRLAKKKNIKASRASYEKAVMKKRYTARHCGEEVYLSERITCNANTLTVSYSAWFSRSNRGFLPVINI